MILTKFVQSINDMIAVAVNFSKMAQFSYNQTRRYHGHLWILPSKEAIEVTESKLPDNIKN